MHFFFELTYANKTNDVFLALHIQDFAELRKPGEMFAQQTFGFSVLNTEGRTSLCKPCQCDVLSAVRQ